jgi:hypothetical protein
MAGRLLARASHVSGNQVSDGTHPAVKHITDVRSLAWAELHLTFAHVFRKFDMELAEPV